jgi:hypothetical protein
MGKGQPPKECGPADVQKKFDYDYFDCIIRQYAQQDNSYPRRVMVLTKVKGVNKAYKPEYKNVTYFVHTQNQYMPLIYFTPSNNKYNYFYMLSKIANKDTYVGEHFTFGYKLLDEGTSTNKSLDIHFTTYATGFGKPCYLFYNLNENIHSSTDMINKVCNEQHRCDVSPVDLQNRCWFFQNIINLVTPVQNYLQPIPMYGGEVTNDADEQGQFYGKNLDKQFANIFGSLKDVYIDVIEVHLIKSNYGILHAFKNGETMSENSKIYTFGFFLDQNNNIYVTSIDNIVNGLSSGSADIFPPASMLLGSLANATEKDLDNINLPTQALFQQLLPTNTNNTKLVPALTQPQRAPSVLAGGRKKKDKAVGRTSENRKKKV